MTKTIRSMVIDHAHSLHQGITDCGADEFESTLLQVTRQAIGNGSFRRHFAGIAPGIGNGTTVDELPQVSIEATEILLHFEIMLGINDCRRNLERLRTMPGSANSAATLASPYRATLAGSKLSNTWR